MSTMTARDPYRIDGDQTDMFPSFTHSGGRTIDERFQQFHTANPWVLDRLEEMMHADIADGVTRGGIGMYWELLRWRHRRATVDKAAPFRADNDYRSRYAALIVERNPEWSTFLHRRVIRAA